MVKASGASLQITGKKVTNAQSPLLPRPHVACSVRGPHSDLLSLLGPVLPQLGGWSCHLLSCTKMASPRPALPVQGYPLHPHTGGICGTAVCKPSEEPSLTLLALQRKQQHFSVVLQSPQDHKTYASPQLLM